MPRLRRFFLRLYNFLRPQDAEGDLAREVASHLALIEDDYRRAGMSPADARRAARLVLGGVEQIKERHRDARSFAMLESLWRDIRLSVRGFRRSPGFFFAAVITLALGIGANAAIFSIVNSLLLRVLPVKDPGRLVFLTDGDAVRAKAWTYPIWEQIRKRELFENVAASSLVQFDLSSGGETEFIDGLWASGSFFDTLGVPALLGRTLTNTDDQRGGGVDGPVAVISYTFWQRRFAGSTDVLGQSLRLNGVGYTIVGVTPPAFFGINIGRRFDVIVPLATEPLVHGRDSFINATNLVSFLTVVGRLKPGQSLAAAAAAVRAAQPGIRSETIGQLAQFGSLATTRYLSLPLALIPATTGQSDLRELYERPLFTLLVIVALVLSVACVNIANLLLARSIARRHEHSLLLTLGASRWRLARQLLTECLILSAAGTVPCVLGESPAGRTICDTGAYDLSRSLNRQEAAGFWGGPHPRDDAALRGRPGDSELARRADGCA
jgi:putative ABC transport system permease protein